ncbi:hypothetical protein [Bacillus atrophaeus]|uniref:hypothetical protein n=1 Tax=Bacillus atrophaeus TaxID=1452 RepID=UPI00077A199C|nr:hypothetical protein [Bacillus atrophaeus]KXZ13277.1 hypothetical protein AXI57_16105 [Bacillus atrophaeus]MED4806313.1 hypothetical protein [Bacillus atrophaeus]UFD97655.1 hypothetical protein [Bacillus atrophaeus]GED04464.1 hypothetical protein BAT02nite_41080 [Bacillus atrophaeus]
MILVRLNNTATIYKPITTDSGRIINSRYKDLPAHLETAREIEIDYPFGMKKRLKYIEKLGFKLKETLHFDNEAPYRRNRQIWSK